MPSSIIVKDGIVHSRICNTNTGMESSDLQLLSSRVCKNAKKNLSKTLQRRQNNNTICEGFSNNDSHFFDGSKYSDIITRFVYIHGIGWRDVACSGYFQYSSSPGKVICDLCARIKSCDNFYRNALQNNVKHKSDISNDDFAPVLSTHTNTNTPSRDQLLILCAKNSKKLKYLNERNKILISRTNLMREQMNNLTEENSSHELDISNDSKDDFKR